jgi:hypothetical protein
MLFRRSFIVASAAGKGCVHLVHLPLLALLFQLLIIDDQCEAVGGMQPFFKMALQPLWALAAFQFPHLFTIGRTSWTSDQLVARLLPKHRINTYTHQTSIP